MHWGMQTAENLFGFESSQPKKGVVVMKKMAIFLMLPLLLCGCAWQKIPTGPLCRVVTQVRVTANAQGRVSENTYTHSPQMESVLCYLRLLKKGRPTDIDPDSFRADTYEITVFYSDGAHTTYRQVHSSFLQTDGGRWEQIEGANLQLLFPKF